MDWDFRYRACLEGRAFVREGSLPHKGGAQTILQVASRDVDEDPGFSICYPKPKPTPLNS